MTNLEQQAKEVPPTSLTGLKNVQQKDISEVFAKVISFYELNYNEQTKLSQGATVEKLKQTPTHKIFLEAMVSALDSIPMPSFNNKQEEAIYLTNKKVLKDLLFSVSNVFGNYSYNDKDLKLILLGKLIQSLYGNK